MFCFWASICHIFFKRLFCQRLVTLMSNWKEYFVIDFGLCGNLWWCGLCDTTKTLNPMSIDFFAIWWSNHSCTIGKEILSRYGANKPNHKYSCKNEYKVIHLQIAPILDDFNGFFIHIIILGNFNHKKVVEISNVQSKCSYTCDCLGLWLY